VRQKLTRELANSVHHMGPITKIRTK